MSSELARYLAHLSEEYDVRELPQFLISFAQRVMLPLAVILASVAGFLKLIHRILRAVVPLPPPKRHEEIKNLYRKGFREQALYEWKRDLPTYGPALLSRACHEIYVLHRTKVGMDLLQVLLQKSKDANDLLKEVQNMKADALAIHHGNVRMVDMNARLAKQEYLGISTI